MLGNLFGNYLKKLHAWFLPSKKCQSMWRMWFSLNIIHSLANVFHCFMFSEAVLSQIHSKKKSWDILPWHQVHISCWTLHFSMQIILSLRALNPMVTHCDCGFYIFSQNVKAKRNETKQKECEIFAGVSSLPDPPMTGLRRVTSEDHFSHGSARHAEPADWQAHFRGCVKYCNNGVAYRSDTQTNDTRRMSIYWRKKCH